MCDSDDIGFVVAVFGGWTPAWSRFVGARGSNFRDWAVDVMDNN